MEALASAGCGAHRCGHAGRLQLQQLNLEQHVRQLTGRVFGGELSRGGRWRHQLLRIRFGSFVFASLLSGIGAVIAVAAIGGYNATTSDTYLLPVFAAVFLSTAIFEPGRFNPLGTLIGIYFLETGILGLQLLGLQS